MKRSLLSTIISIAVFAVLAGCALFSPVRGDLEKYVNEGVLPLADEEERILSTYDSVTGANYTDDYTLYVELEQNIIPAYRDFISELEAIKIQTDEVRNVHEIFIEASNMQYSAFVKMLAALELGDYEMIIEINSTLDEARKKMRDYQMEIEKLARAHGLELIE